MLKATDVDIGNPNLQNLNYWETLGIGHEERILRSLEGFQTVSLFPTGLRNDYVNHLHQKEDVKIKIYLSSTVITSLTRNVAPFVE